MLAPSPGYRNIFIYESCPMNEPKLLKMKPKMDKLDQLTETLCQLIENKFTGHLKINFSQGGIGRVEKFEEIMKG